MAWQVAEAGIRLHVLRKRRRIDLAILRRLVGLVKQIQVDIVHTHLVTANTWGRLAGLLGEVPVIVATEHNVDLWVPEQ